MLHHYFSAAVRNLSRNKLYAAINIAGLTVGLAAAFIVTLYVRHESTFERFIPGYERIYRISATAGGTGMSALMADTTLPDLAPWLRNRLPALQPLARINLSDNHGVRVGPIKGLESIGWADPQFFEIFRLPSIAGNLSTALSRPDGVVLTRSRARKYFGRDDPIGESVEIDGKFSLVVTAVIRDLPSDTHLAFDVVASSRSAYSPFIELDAQPLRSVKPWLAHTYFRLPPGMSVAQIRSALDTLIAEFPRRTKGAADIQLSLPIDPIASIHLLAPGMAGMRSRGSAALIYGISAVGALILLVAAINFINLSTARAATRRIEVAVRKTAGARRADLIVQFLGEALGLAALAGIAGFALVELLLPMFNRLAQSSLTLHAAHEPSLLLFNAALVLVLGLAAGGYPALVLSSFQPIATLRGRHSRVARAVARQLLVTVQFAFLIGLLIVIAVIFQQVSYARRMVDRLNTSEVFAVGGACRGDSPQMFKALPGVVSAACSASAPLGFIEARSFGVVRAGIQTWFTNEVVDFGFFELYDIKPLAGRLFSREHGTDSAVPDKNLSTAEAAILNETAVRRFGFSSPATAVGQSIDVFGDRPSQIIGVVPDFPTRSIRTPIDPTVFHIDPTKFQMLSIKVDGTRTPQALAAIDSLWRKLDSSRPISRTSIALGMRGLYADILSEGAAFSSCCVIALLLAALGMVGLASFVAERRTKEIGIRKATGAGRNDVLRLLIWELTQPVLWANLIAWPACYLFLRHWLAGFAYPIQLGLGSFMGGSLVALLIAWFTVLWSTQRVAAANPVTALRYE